MNILDLPFPDTPPPPTRSWSDYQVAIFDSVERNDESLIVQAVAGSGKTTTLIEAMRYAKGSSITLAFNKQIQLELASRLVSGEAKTFNAIGWAQWARWRPDSKLDSRKVSKILARMLGEDSEVFKEHGYMLSRAVGLMKNNAFGIEGYEDSEEAVQELIDSYFDVPAELLSQFAAYAYKALEASIQDESIHDFDDQLYMPAYNGWSYPQYDNIFPDECQDLSPIQHLMLTRMGQSAFICAVGDRHQAIYGFRGALHDSMDQLKSRFSMLELPLSISYRCPTSVIAEAQRLCPHIQARPGAPAGSIELAESDPKLFDQGLIISRNNAPLFSAILRHVRAKSPCQVRTNFLESFQGFIRGFKTTYTSELKNKLDHWYEREREAARKRGFKGKQAALTDKYETVCLLIKEFSKTADVLALVKRLGDSTSGPIFSTIHKAKGLEDPNVYLLRPDLCPSPWATTPEAKQQENNLLYVAITRSQDKLTYGEML